MKNEQEQPFNNVSNVLFVDNMIEEIFGNSTKKGHEKNFSLHHEQAEIAIFDTLNGDLNTANIQQIRIYPFVDKNTREITLRIVDETKIQKNENFENENKKLSQSNQTNFVDFSTKDLSQKDLQQKIKNHVKTILMKKDKNTTERTITVSIHIMGIIKI